MTPGTPGLKPAARAVVPLVMAVGLFACGGSPTTPSPPSSTLAAPVVDSPADGAEVSGVRPTLTVINVFSAQSAIKTYDFQVGTTADFAQPLVSKTGVAESTSGKTSYLLEQDLALQTRYYWRARAMQGSTIGTWSAASSFRTAANTPPAIKSVIGQGSKLNEPVNFADLGEEITLKVVAEDAQTPADRLTYEWSAPSGSVTGSGASVTWRAPSSASVPTKVTIRVTVSDGPAPNGASSTGDVTIDVHDSPKEIGDMAVQFLVDFSKQISPSEVLKNFTDSCPGKASELADVQRNQRCFTIAPTYKVGTAKTTVNFKGTCPFRSRAADACSAVPVEWRSTTISSAAECGGQPVGTKGVVVGTDWVTAVYLNSRWWLCDSDFDGTSTPGTLFKK